MIIAKYLLKETFKNQISILLILLLIFFCQKLIKALSAAVNGEIPVNLIFFLLGLALPEMAKLILPLSLFLSLMITFFRFYVSNEIVVMHACGLKKIALIKVAMILALLTGILAIISVMWAAPWSFRYQNKILDGVKISPNIAALSQGQFQKSYRDDSVIFIKSVNNNYFYNIFLARPYQKNRGGHPLVIIANSGKFIKRKDGSQSFILNKGICFEKTSKVHDFRVTYFKRYQLILKRKETFLDVDNTEQMNIHTLWNINTNSAKAELHWRVTLVYAVFMMALMVVPLSSISTRQERAFSILPAMVLYLIFFLLQAYFKSKAEIGKIDPAIWMWIVNIMYFLLALILNLWDTVLIRRIRIHLILLRNKYT